MKYTFRFILTLLAGSMISVMYAQPSLPTEQVEVIKNFDARLADALKIVLSPAALEIDTLVIRQNYEIDPKPVGLTYDPPKLRPLALRREKLPDHFNGYIKAGYGLPSSPLIEAGYYFKNEEQFDAHIGIKHHSANNNNLENQRFAYTGILADGNYHFPQRFSVEGEIGFDQDLVSYYGYNHADTSFTREETKQRFNKFHLGAALYNTNSNSFGVDYRFDMKYYGLKDFFDASEDGFDLELQLVKWFADSHPLRIEIGNDYSGFNDTIDKSLNNFYIKPSFTFHGEFFRIKAGLNIVTVKEQFKILPDVEVLLSLAGNAFGIYAGWKGDYHQNSFDNLRSYNPYIASQFEPRSTVYKDIYGGIKGASSGWNYQAQVGLKSFEDLALYLPDSLDRRKFAILYDTGSAFYISGSAAIELWKGMEVSGTFLQNFYTLDNEEKAWHLPGFETNVSLRYKTMENKLLLKGELFMANGVSFLSSTGETDRLGNLFDISVSGYYQMLNNFGLWMQVNNLTNNKRERWESYPSFGINILGGILFRF